MDKQVKKPSKSNLKLATKNVSPKNINIKSQNLDSVQGLIAVTSDKVEKVEHQVKENKKQSDKVLKKTLLLDGLC